MNVFVEFVVTLLIGLIAASFAVNLGRRSNLRIRSLSPRTADIVFLVLALAYALIFGALSLLRHESFHSGGFDVGIFDQVIWNSLHGRLFENSIRIDAPSFLAQHFSPLLLMLVPLYAVWSDPRTLLITQTIALTIAAFPLYWFAREKIGVMLALGVTAAYFLFPSLQYVNLFEFHEIALATPLLAFSVYFLLHRRYKPFLVCLLLALLAKEEVAFIVAAFGVYILLVPGKRTLGMALVFLGVAYAVVTFKYIIPYFFGQSYDANFFVMDRYGYLGKTISGIAITAITRPGLVLQHLLVSTKIEFLLQLLVPLAFIPVLGGEVFALSLPTIDYLLIGDYSYQNSIHYQYTAPIIPFLFFALVIGLGRLTRWAAAKQQKLDVNFEATLATMIVVLALANYYFQSSGPLSVNFDPEQYDLNARVALGYQLLAKIPPNAKVMAESDFVPHLSERRLIYQAPNVVDLRSVDYVLADTRFGSYADYKSTWDNVLSSPYFQTTVEQDGYILRKRTPYIPKTSLEIQYDYHITLLGYTIESSLPARRGAAISMVLVWRADEAIHKRLVVFVHLLGIQNHIWSQGDHEPANGWFRTDRWQAGDVTPDRYELDLDPAMPPGEYSITAGLYAVDSLKRSNARDGSGNNLGDEPVIAKVTVK